MMALAGAACSSLSSLPPGSYPGGTFTTPFTVPSQTMSKTVGPCTASFTTAPMELNGATVTIPGFTVGTAATITIPNVNVNIPTAQGAAGSATVMCTGFPSTTIPFDVSFTGTVSTQTATLNTATKVITLDTATLRLTTATATIPGFGTVPLPATTVTLPAITLTY